MVRLSQERRQRFQTVMQMGVDSWSLFTGKCTGPSCLHWIAQTAWDNGIETCERPISTISGCDNDECSIHVMVNFRVPDAHGRLKHGFRHVFPSVQSMTSDTAQAKLDQLRPPKSASNEAKQLAYLAMREYLYNNLDEVFGGSGLTPKGECRFCQTANKQCKKCPIFDERLETKIEGVVDLTTDSQSLQCPPNCIHAHEECNSQDSQKTLVLDECMPTQKKLHERPHFTLIEFGSQCVDVSSYGLRQILGGPSAEPFYICMAMLLHFEPHGFCSEIAALMTKDVVATEIGHKFQCIEGNVEPWLFGKPVKRPSVMTWGVFRKKVEFHGSYEEFLSLSRTATVSDGSVYYLLDGERASERLELARLQGNHHNEDIQPPIESCFTGSKLARVEERISKASQHASTDGVYLFDADATHGFCEGSCLVPTLASHGTILLVAEKDPSGGRPSVKIMSSTEHLIVAGEPLGPKPGRFKSFIAESVLDMAPTEKKRAAGDAFDATCFGLWMMYFLCNVTLKDDLPEPDSKNNEGDLLQDTDQDPLEEKTSKRPRTEDYV